MGEKPSLNMPRAQHQRADFHKWKRKYQGMELADAKKLKALEEEENSRLKGLVAEKALDVETLDPSGSNLMSSISPLN